MIDRKIPAADRDGLPVLAAQNGIAAVAGLGADEVFLARGGDMAVVIQIEKEECANVE